SVKLLDYRHREKALAGSDNPFGLVTLAHLQTQRTRHQSERRYRAKYSLIRLLYGQGWQQHRIIPLLRIIDWLMALPPHLEQSLRQRLATVEGEKHMQYVTSFERLAREEGVQQGMEEGMQQGIQQGMQQGMQEGMQQGLQQGLQQGQTELLMRQLTHRFGPLPVEVRQRLAQASVEDIDTWADRVLDADSLDQVLGD